MADELGEGLRAPALAVAEKSTASLVLSYRIDSGTPPKKPKAETWPSRNASVVSAA
jgi:hypothetical protein